MKKKIKKEKKKIIESHHIVLFQNQQVGVQHQHLSCYLSNFLGNKNQPKKLIVQKAKQPWGQLSQATKLLSGQCFSVVQAVHIRCGTGWAGALCVCRGPFILKQCGRGTPKLSHLSEGYNKVHETRIGPSS